MIERHSHSGLGGDGEKIDFKDLINKPTSDSFTGTHIITSTADITITTGFRPGSVTIKAFFTSANNDTSISWTTLNIAGTDLVTTTTLNDNVSLGSGTSIDAVSLGASNNANIGEFTETGFTLTGISRTQNMTLNISVIS